VQVDRAEFANVCWRYDVQYNSLVLPRASRPFMKISVASRLWLVLAFCSFLSCKAYGADASPLFSPDDLHNPVVSTAPAGFARDWSVQLGVAFITQNNIGQILSGEIEPARGDAGGQLYSLTLTWTARRFENPCDWNILRPHLEPYLTLTLVDENRRPLFPDYNGGVGVRLVDFPWDRWVKTTFFTGIGLSYSSYVYTIDRERHPGQERSHLKLDWPIHLTFAIPRWPQHELVIFNDHQSGGHIFDKGGVNSIGIGYRFSF
jgi:hypothetical protein